MESKKVFFVAQFAVKDFWEGDPYLPNPWYVYVIKQSDSPLFRNSSFFLSWAVTCLMHLYEGLE